LCASEDYEFIIRKVQKKHPKAPIVALGTSMGAGLLLRHAAETGEKCLLKAIVAVATPFDYIKCRAKLNHWWPYFGFSDAYIVKSLHDQVDQVLLDLSMMEDDIKEKGISIDEVMNVKSSQEFDEKLTIKICDCKSTEQYYLDASVDQHVHKIKVPVLALSSKDDPIVSIECVPVDKIVKNPNIILALTHIGGHVAFYSGIVPKRSYADLCLEYLDSVLNSKSLS
jgi:predicted alpha/beta-fold hydrolase